MPVLLYLLALAVFVQGTSEFVLVGLLSGISDDLGVSLGQAGLLTSAFAVGMVLGAPTMAAVGRRFPPRWTLTGFLALFIVVHVIGAVTEDFGVLLATRVLAALANAGFLAVALSTVAQLVPANRQTRALSIILGGTTVALIAGVPAGAFVGTVLGWRATLWAIAALSVPALAAVLLGTPTRMSPTTTGVPKSTLARELRALRARPVQLNMTLALLVNAATFCAFTYLAVIAVGPAGFSESAIPMLLAVFGVGAFIGVVVSGKFGDTHAKRLITITGPLLLLGWLLFTTTVTFPPAVWALAFAQGVLSFALGSTLIGQIIGTAQQAPTMGGAFATVALNLGAVVGPITGGIAYEVMGVRGPLLASAAFVLITVIVWWIVEAGTLRTRRAADARAIS